MGFVRYQTVRNIGLGVLGVGAITGGVLLVTGSRPEKMAAVAPAPAPTPTADPSTFPEDKVIVRRPPAPPPSPMVTDAMIVEVGNRAATPGGKIKDAFEHAAVKVNLYEDTQDTVYDRLKVDRNRDEQWDEEWTREAGGPWKRGDGMLYLNGAWTTPGTSAQPTPETPPGQTLPVAAEPYAKELATVATTILDQRATGAKIKDLFRGAGPKVNIYDDNGDGRWDRAKVDFDRDEVDDEKLTVKDGVLERKNEKTGAIAIWEGGAWKPKPSP